MAVNKLSAILVTLLLLAAFAGYHTMFAKNKTRFEWLTTESAPKNYTMKIMNGTFYYHNEKGGLYVPTAARINPGWGTGVSNHVVGEDFKALPDRLDIRYFSFTEDKFYQGSFDLPYEKILALFQAGVQKNKERPTFNTIMVGVAPGGAVAVWVSGSEQREVFFGQAEPYDGVLTDSLNNVVDDREEFVRSRLENALKPEVLAEIRNNGVPIGRWAEYRKQYHWVPTFVQSQRPKYASVSFFNGEDYRLNFPLEESVQKASRPVSLLLSFAYLMEGRKFSDFFTTRFNDREILAAFEKRGAEEMICVECDPKLPKDKTTMRVYNSKQSIQLLETTIDDD